MADSVKVELITRDFNRMLEEFERIDPSVEFRTVVREVAIRVIAGALRRTAAASVAGIRADAGSREWITLDGKVYKLSNRFPDRVWGRIQRRRTDDLNKRLNARGLSKQSWLHQARDLGGNIQVPNFVDRANYKGQQYPVDANHRESRGGANYSLTILNSSPIVQNAGGQNALISAMAAETRYFYTLLQKGAFRTASSRASKYPGIFTRPTGTN